MTDKEIEYICQAIREIAENHCEWAKDYEYSAKVNEFIHPNDDRRGVLINDWFKIGLQS